MELRLVDAYVTPEVSRAAGAVDRRGPYFPEFDLSPEERLEAIAKILLDAIREMDAERNREKTRRCRANQAAAVAPESRDKSTERPPGTADT